MAEPSALAMKLLEGMVEVDLDGPLGNIQLTSNLLVLQTFRYQQHDLPLATGKACNGVAVILR